VEEFSIVTSNSGLEIGKSSAGAVNVVTKSGTNAIHGDAFWFIRNTSLNANNFFSTSPDGLKRNQTGGALGGPIIKDKLFLFGGYQRTWVRQITGSNSITTLPAIFRTGDFSSLLPKTVINDPNTGQPFPGNIIPQSRFSPAAIALLKYSPVPGADGLTHYSLFSQQDASDYVVRGDYRPTARHSILARFFKEQYTLASPAAPNNIHSVQRGLNAPTTNATLGYTFMVSPTLISDTHLTMARQVGTRTIPLDEVDRRFRRECTACLRRDQRPYQRHQQS
jgi:hypothetical protein